MSSHHPPPPTEVLAIWLPVMTLGDGGQIEFLVRPGADPPVDGAVPADVSAYRLRRCDGTIDVFPTMRAVGDHLSRRPEPTGFAVRQSTQDDLLVLSTTLADEFSGRVAAGTVLRAVARARDHLLAAGVREGLVVAVETMARARLEHRASLGARGRPHR